MSDNPEAVGDRNKVPIVRFPSGAERVIVPDEDFALWLGTPKELAQPCTNPGCQHSKAAHRHEFGLGWLALGCIAADCQCTRWQG